MEDQLKDYIEMQKAKYNFRENARNTITKTFETNTSKIETAGNLHDMEAALKQMDIAFKNFPSSISPPSGIQDKGYNVLNTINTNTNVKVNFSDVNDLELSKNIQNLVKNILEQCGIKSGDMNVEYSMDTSRDEEVAKEIDRTLNKRPPPQPRRRRDPPPSPVQITNLPTPEQKPDPPQQQQQESTNAKPKRGRKPRPLVNTSDN
jgi:hypothetical protein